MFRILAVFAALLLPLFAIAADPPVSPPAASGPGVSDVAPGELMRRGNGMEILGEFRAGPEAVLNAINSPPEDDSDRCFLTLIVTDDPKYAEACDRIRQDINALKLRGYVLPDKPAESWTHYSVRLWRIKKGDKPDPSESWFSKMLPYIEGKEFPILVLQPPRNGEHGKNKRPMGFVYGYGNGPDGFAGEPAFTISRLQAIVQEYAQSRYANGLVSDEALNPIQAAQGHAQRGRAKIPPPFEVEDQPIDLQQPSKVWPPHLEKKEPEKPKPYNYGQVRKLAPDAPVKWVRELVRENVTTDDEVIEAYDEWKESQKPKPKVESPPSSHEPLKPVPDPASCVVPPVTPAGSVALVAPVTPAVIPQVTHDDTAYANSEAETETVDPQHPVSFTAVLVAVGGIGLIVLLAAVAGYLFWQSRKREQEFQTTRAEFNEMKARVQGDIAAARARAASPLAPLSPNVTTSPSSSSGISSSFSSSGG